MHLGRAPLQASRILVVASDTASRIYNPTRPTTVTHVKVTERPILPTANRVRLAFLISITTAYGLETVLPAKITGKSISQLRSLSNRFNMNRVEIQILYDPYHLPISVGLHYGWLFVSSGVFP